MDQIVRRAIITEKSMDDAGKGKFTFEVSSSATKHGIKKTIEEQFKVNVLDVATITVPGKKKKRMTRRGARMNSTPSWKKAIVLLKAGQKISLFEQGAA